MVESKYTQELKDDLHCLENATVSTYVPTRYRDIHQAKLYELEANLNHENEMMDQLTAEMEQLWGEIEATKVKCKYLSEFAKKNNIPIKDLSTTHHDGQSD